jgi:3-methyladenine DNA glycosylase AlkC
MMTSTRTGLRPADVAISRRLELETGSCESKNFMEQIAIDQSKLLVSVIPEASAFGHRLRSSKLTDRMKAGGDAVLESLTLSGLSAATSWTSDTARSWAAMAVGQAPGLDIGERLNFSKMFANDSHFAVREWAWISVRPYIAVDVTRSIGFLDNWCHSESEYLRRFASEVTRPRGVWSKHIGELKRNPELAESILDELRSDTSRYVQMSVGNWLNDAGKSRPDWVHKICHRWLSQPSKETRYICSRGQRSLTPHISTECPR